MRHYRPDRPSLVLPAAVERLGELFELPLVLKAKIEQKLYRSWKDVNRGMRCVTICRRGEAVRCDVDPSHFVL